MVTDLTLLESRKRPEQVLFAKANTWLNRPSAFKPGPDFTHWKVGMPWFVTKPEWCGWGFTLALDLGTNDRKGRLRILFVVKMVPASQANFAPTFIDKLALFDWFPPGGRVFECKRSAMFGWTPFAFVEIGRAHV